MSPDKQPKKIINESNSEEQYFSENKELVSYFKSSAKTASFIPENLIKNLLPVAKKISCKPGEEILVQGQKNKDIYILIKGTLLVYADGEYIATLKQKGDLIGEMSVITNKPCSATVKADKDVELICIDVTEFDADDDIKISPVQHTLYRIFNKVLSEKLASTNEKAKQFEIVNRELIKAQKDLEDLVEKLEMLVDERTKAIRAILDNVQSGFLICNGETVIQPAYTKSCHDIFKRDDLEGMKLTEAMQLGPEEADHFMIMYGQVFEGFLPVDTALSQVPERFSIGERTFSIKGSALHDEKDTTHHIMFTIIDITLQEKIQRENELNLRLLDILRNKDYFVHFINDSRHNIELAKRNLAQGDQNNVRSEIHTIKGNAGGYKLDDIVNLIHDIEEKDKIELVDLDKIKEKFIEYLSHNYSMLKMSFAQEEEKDIILRESELLELKYQLDQCDSLQEMSKLVYQFIDEADNIEIANLVGSLPTMVERLAQNSAKLAEMVITGGHIRVDPEKMSPVLRNLSHLVRNSIDHGIEPFDKRGGKPEKAMISLEFHKKQYGLYIKYSDDGEGIDAEQIAVKAVEKGIVTESEIKNYSDKKKLELIFHPGFSTSQSVSTVSGRGVGMAAVKNCVDELGGSISIVTILNQGTTFTIFIPQIYGQQRKAS